jgi:hypothetical protein
MPQPMPTQSDSGSDSDSDSDSDSECDGVQTDSSLTKASEKLLEDAIHWLKAQGSSPAVYAISAINEMRHAAATLMMMDPLPRQSVEYVAQQVLIQLGGLVTETAVTRLQQVVHVQQEKALELLGSRNRFPAQSGQPGVQSGQPAVQSGQHGQSGVQYAQYGQPGQSGVQSSQSGQPGQPAQSAQPGVQSGQPPATNPPDSKHKRRRLRLKARKKAGTQAK